MSLFDKHYMLWLIVLECGVAFGLACLMAWRMNSWSRRGMVASGVAALVMALVGEAIVHFAPDAHSALAVDAWASILGTTWCFYSVAVCMVSKAIVDDPSKRQLPLTIAAGWLFWAVLLTALISRAAAGHH